MPWAADKTFLLSERKKKKKKRGVGVGGSDATIL